ncbi:MAG: universal stress protein [Cellvibrionaceae bacterium]
MPQEFKHVIVPVDFSDDSERALETALTVFGDKADEISLITVCESVSNRHTEMIAEIDEMMEDTVQKEVQTFVKKFEGRHKNLKAYVRKGSAAPQILLAAKEMNADLIVMGSQGRNSLARVFFGSTTYDVARKAHCSVFVIRF